MFYFLPVRGEIDAFALKTFMPNMNVLDTRDNVVECMSADRLYKSRVRFENAHRAKGVFKLEFCPVRQTFGVVHTVVDLHGSFSFNDVVYECELNAEPLTGNFTSLSISRVGKRDHVVLLRSSRKNAHFLFFMLSHVVRFADYYIIPLELSGWKNSVLNVVLFLVFDLKTNFVGVHLVSGFEFVENCSPVHKVLAAKLALVDRKIYF